MGRHLLHTKLVDIVAHGLLGVRRMANQGLVDRFIPPSQEEVMKAYQNEAMFRAQVKTMVVAIVHAVDIEMGDGGR